MVTRPDGATVLVTGGSRGIGAATCQALAADGWRVAVGFNSAAHLADAVVEEISDAGGEAIAVGGDVTNGVAELLFKAGELGPVLGLVNNAGITDDGLALSLSDEQWDRVVATNLTSAFRLTRSALRPMIKARFGRIVSIASVVGPFANPGQANYAAAKAGLIGMTRTVAAEVAHRGVTLNALAPGFIETSMSAEHAEKAIERIPARRAGTPDEVAAAVRFLASADASYVTGATLFVDGGMAALSPTVHPDRLVPAAHHTTSTAVLRFASRAHQGEPHMTDTTTQTTEQFVFATLTEIGTDGDVTATATLESLDVDSLDMAEFAQITEEQLGVKLESKDLKEITSVGDVISLVEARR
jgi:3-oxoacyl-[acyl-carrier protein] reductase